MSLNRDLGGNADKSNLESCGMRSHRQTYRAVVECFDFDSSSCSALLSAIDSRLTLAKYVREHVESQVDSKLHLCACASNQQAAALAKPLPLVAPARGFSRP